MKKTITHFRLRKESLGFFQIKSFMVKCSRFACKASSLLMPTLLLGSRAAAILAFSLVLILLSKPVSDSEV